MNKGKRKKSSCSFVVKFGWLEKFQFMLHSIALNARFLHFLPPLSNKYRVYKLYRNKLFR